ncbi:MAG: hypothetical protein RPU39_08565, partial [Candidatus Sedimenticola sp. (ex Thyasira tokunagai)]
MKIYIYAESDDIEEIAEPMSEAIARWVKQSDDAATLVNRCQPWRAKRGLVIPGSREAALLTRRARSAPEGKQSRHPNTASSHWEL